MGRFRCSRWTDLSVHDGPKRATGSRDWPAARPVEPVGPASTLGGLRLPRRRSRVMRAALSWFAALGSLALTADAVVVEDGWQRHSWGLPCYDSTIVEVDGHRALHMRGEDENSTTTKEVITNTAGAFRNADLR